MLDLPVDDIKQTRVYQQGLEQGREQGLEQGLEQGREQGREQGIEQVARNLLQSGMPLEQIARVTELSLERIQELSQEN